ncbi:hypothetical protein CRG98_031017 [Punica granatum]|uniref:Uncharacterized protein n=1 Tax=Punica granatum TaxID=22663 RepID=A0A2I0IX75_PUNGR|nr:hypothetical protein CRG98_031017 [Punica granatum]
MAPEKDQLARAVSGGFSDLARVFPTPKGLSNKLVKFCAKRTERLTCRPRLEINNRRRPRNPRMRLSQCFPSVLMCSKTTVISVCQKRVPKTCREAYFRVPFICSWMGHPRSPVRRHLQMFGGASA